jgi:iron complex outermembrane receptor protein
VTLPLMQLSKYSANATIYYETDTWGMRLSSAYRDGYLTGAGGNGNIGDGLQGDQQHRLRRPLQRQRPKLKLTLEGINLTNQHSIQYTDIAAKRTTVNTAAAGPS